MRKIGIAVAIAFLAMTGPCLLAQKKETTKQVLGHAIHLQQHGNDQAAAAAHHHALGLLAFYGNEAKLGRLREQRKIIENIDKLKIEEQEIKKKFGPAHPSYALVRTKIAVEKNKLARAAENVLEAMHPIPVDSRISACLEELDKVNQKFQPKNSLEKELKYLTTKLIVLQRKKELGVSPLFVRRLPKVRNDSNKAISELFSEYQNIPRFSQGQKLKSLADQNRKIIETRKRFEGLYKSLENRSDKVRTDLLALKRYRELPRKFQGYSPTEAENKAEKLRKEYLALENQRADLYRKLKEHESMQGSLHKYVQEVAGSPVKTVKKNATVFGHKVKANSVENRLNRLEKKVSGIDDKLDKILNVLSK